MLPVFRVFLSSPGDVAEERALAQRVLRRLGEQYAGRLAIEPVVWEHEPLVATDTFQAQIVRPSEADVVVCILWARLGTRLPAGFTRPDGTRYQSGTEFEFEDAVQGFRTRGTPDLLVYRKGAEPVVSMRDAAAALQKVQQKAALDAFVDQWFHDQRDGTLRAAFHPFEEPAQFEELLELHLRKLIARRHPDVVAGDSALRAGWSEGSPFRGLGVFDAAHAPVFFGRTRESAEVLHALRARAAAGSAFVLVLGMSGSGKSSLARAGVLPLLTQPGVIPDVRRWHTAVMHPAEVGGQPLESLVRACMRAQHDAEPADQEVEAIVRMLREDPDRAPTSLALLGYGRALALVIDQLEELFTHPPVVRGDDGAFVAAVAALARSGRAWIVATMRSDMFALSESLPALVELKEGEGQFHLLPPTPAQIAEMVTGPARLAGLRFEEGGERGERLERLLVDAAAANPESLPLLEFTLEELYKRRTSGGVLTLEAYRALGGVEGALARRAEEVYASLDRGTQGALPELLRAVVATGTGAGGAPTRRSAATATLSPAATALARAFVEARLFTADTDEHGRAVVTIAHEALLRHWPRVQEWVRDNAEVLRARARLESAAALWRDEGEPDERLLPEGKPLADAVDLDTRFGEELPAELRRYVSTSRRVRTGARQRRRRRVLLLAGAVTAGSLLFAGFSYVQWRRAASARELASSQRLEALRASESLLTDALALGPPTGQLGEDQLAKLQDVLSRLAATGYRDTVELLVHPGRFLLREGNGGALAMTASDCAGGCREYPTPEEEAALVARISALLEQEVVRRMPDVPLRVRGMAASEPWDPYPPDRSDPRSWNAAAARNHRVIVLLAGG